MHEIHEFRLPGDGFGFITHLVCTKVYSVVTEILVVVAVLRYHYDY